MVMFDFFDETKTEYKQHYLHVDTLTNRPRSIKNLDKTKDEEQKKADLIENLDASEEPEADNDENMDSEEELNEDGVDDESYGSRE